MTVVLPVVLGLVAGAASEWVMLRLLIPMLVENGAVGRNYLDREIAVSTGISFSMALFLVGIVYRFFPWYDASYHLFLLGLVTVSLLGFIDDMLGKRDTLGFKGHIGALLRGRLTTGGLKAVGGGLTAFFLALVIGGTWWQILLNTLVMALFTNLLNLFDLRPGRAVKGYLLFLLLMVALAGGKLDWLLVVPLLGAVLVYFPLDVKARVMMGDAGSNVLGLSLGYLAVISLSDWARLGLLFFLIAIHLYTEKYSLSETIEKVAVLRALDQLGRSRGQNEST